MAPWIANGCKKEQKGEGSGASQSQATGAMDVDVDMELDEEGNSGNGIEQHWSVHLLIRKFQTLLGKVKERKL